MDVWKLFDENEITHSAAHYLMAIDHLLRRHGYARVSDVARFLEVTTGSASVSLRALKEKGLVGEDRNKFLQLTETGAAIAHKVEVNKQMLVTMLTDLLRVSPEVAEIDACKIEHLLSDETRQKMRIFLGFIKSQTSGGRLISRALSKFNFECPGTENCDVCEEKCGFAELAHMSDENSEND